MFISLIKRNVNSPCLYPGHVILPSWWSLSDPKSYASWDLSPWQVQPCRIGRGGVRPDKGQPLALQVGGWAWGQSPHPVKIWTDYRNPKSTSILLLYLVVFAAVNSEYWLILVILLSGKCQTQNLQITMQCSTKYNSCKVSLHLI